MFRAKRRPPATVVFVPISVRSAALRAERYLRDVSNFDRNFARPARRRGRDNRGNERIGGERERGGVISNGVDVPDRRVPARPMVRGRRARRSRPFHRSRGAVNVDGGQYRNDHHAAVFTTAVYRERRRCLIIYSW